MLEANLALLRTTAATVTVLGRSADENAIRGAVAHADGVLLSGGGLSDTWQDLVDQRPALLTEAVRRSVPVVAGGQTIGPLLRRAARCAGRCTRRRGAARCPRAAPHWRSPRGSASAPTASSTRSTMRSCSPGRRRSTARCPRTAVHRRHARRLVRLRGGIAGLRGGGAARGRGGRARPGARVAPHVASWASARRRRPCRRPAGAPRRAAGSACHVLPVLPVAEAGRVSSTRPDGLVPLPPAGFATCREA